MRAKARLVCLLLLAGCDLPAPDLSAEVPFDQAGPQWLHKRLLPVAGDAGPPDPAPGGACAGVMEMLSRIEARMRSDKAPDPVLDAIDRCFERLGRGPELVAFYQRVRLVAPDDPRWIARLAGAFVTLGDAAEALRVLADAKPDDPASLFLRGLILASQAPTDPVAKRAARDSWRRLLQVAPNHAGLDSVSPEQIRGRVERWSEELGEAPPASAPPTPAKPTAAVAVASPAAVTATAQPAALAQPSADALYAKALFEAATAPNPAAKEAAYRRALDQRPEDPAALAGLERLEKKKPAGP